MARGRMVSRTVADDEALNALSIEAALLYLMTVPHLDRDGLITGEPGPLWGTVTPRRLELLPKIEPAIQEWIEHSLVTAYTHKRGRVLYFRGFQKNQAGMRYDREAPSAFPPPPGYIRTADEMREETEADRSLVPDNSGPTPELLPQESGVTPLLTLTSTSSITSSPSITTPPNSNLHGSQPANGKARAPGVSGGGGVSETPERYVAFQFLQKVAPDFNRPEEFVRSHDPRLVAYCCLAAGERPETVDNPAGLIRSLVEKEEWPRLPGRLTDQWKAAVRSAYGQQRVA